MIFFLMRNRRLSLHLFLGVLFLIGSMPSGSKAAIKCYECNGDTECAGKTASSDHTECAGNADDMCIGEIEGGKLVKGACGVKPTDYKQGCIGGNPTTKCMCHDSTTDGCNKDVDDAGGLIKIKCVQCKDGGDACTPTLPDPKECADGEICVLKGTLPGKDITEADCVAPTDAPKGTVNGEKSVCEVENGNFKCDCAEDECNKSIDEAGGLPPRKCHTCDGMTTPCGDSDKVPSTILSTDCPATEICELQGTAEPPKITKAGCVVKPGDFTANKCTVDDKKIFTCYCDDDGCNNSIEDAGKLPDLNKESPTSAPGGPDDTTNGAGLPISNGKLVFAVLMISLLYYYGAMEAP